MCYHFGIVFSCTHLLKDVPSQPNIHLLSVRSQDVKVVAPTNAMLPLLLLLLRLARCIHAFHNLSSHFSTHLINTTHCIRITKFTLYSFASFTQLTLSTSLIQGYHARPSQSYRSPIHFTRSGYYDFPLESHHERGRILLEPRFLLRAHARPQAPAIVHRVPVV